MSAAVFQITSEGAEVRYGKNVYAAASGSIVPGRLVKKASGSTVSLTSSGDTPCGFAYGGRYATYRPTTSQFADGDALTYVWGSGYCLVSSDYMMTGSLPSAAQTVYAGDNGQMTTTAASNKKVGIVEEVKTRFEAVGGVGLSQTLALIRFHITPYGT